MTRLEKIRVLLDLQEVFYVHWAEEIMNTGTLTESDGFGEGKSWRAIEIETGKPISGRERDYMRGKGEGRENEGRTYDTGGWKDHELRGHAFLSAHDVSWESRYRLLSKGTSLQGVAHLRSIWHDLTGPKVDLVEFIDSRIGEIFLPIWIFDE